MKFVRIACLCIYILAISFTLISCAIANLDGTDFMDAIVERIRDKKKGRSRP